MTSFHKTVTTGIQTLWIFPIQVLYQLSYLVQAVNS